MPSYHLPNEWPLQICLAKEAWELAPLHSRGKAKGEGIIIAHPDTGYTNHPELIKGGRYLTSPPNAKNFFVQRHIEDLSTNTAEDFLISGLLPRHPSHGTSTASLMFSDEGHPILNPPNTDYPYYTVPTGQFVTGIAPKAKVLPLRVTSTVALGGRTLLSSSHCINTYVCVARALDHVVALRNAEIGVVSISLGGLTTQPTLNRALMLCRRKGIIVCAAAGQAFGRRLFPPSFPGRSPHTICVAGCYADLSEPSEGFYGDQVDITAPGWGVTIARTSGQEKRDYEHDPVRNYAIDQNGEGTSYSTALTAGACALWLAYHNRRKLIETYGRPFLFDVFRHCLISSCFGRGSWPRHRGYGVLNVLGLLDYDLPTVAEAESIARNNNWNESHWGDQSNWGRI